MKQDYNILTHKGERVFTRPGKHGPNDMKIYSQFPGQPWPHSLFYAGLILRLKAEVEDRNYPPPNQGAKYLLRFITDCMLEREVPIGELCKRYKIEFPEKGFVDNSAIQSEIVASKSDTQTEIDFEPRSQEDVEMLFRRMGVH